MLTVTEDAKSHCATIIDSGEMPPNTVLRLVAGQEGLGFTPDMANESDAQFDTDGKTVLVIDPKIADKLDGRTLDVTESDKGAKQFELV